MESSNKMWCINSLPVLGSDIMLPTFHNPYQDESEKLFLHKNLDDGCYLLVFHKKSIKWRWGSIMNRPPTNLSLQFSTTNSRDDDMTFNNISSICSFHPEFIFLKLNKEIEQASSNTHKIFVLLSSALSIRLISNEKNIFENDLSIPKTDFDKMFLIFTKIGDK
jgi:hypothetical protein